MYKERARKTIFKPNSMTVEELETIRKYMTGRFYRHKNGNLYTVLVVTNTEGGVERLKDHPVDVVYTGVGGKVWSRPLSKWDRSFTEVNVDSLTANQK